MRFLRLFFKILFVILLAAVLFATIGRESWLYWASWRLTQDVRDITRPQKWQSQVVRCGSGLGISGDVYSGLQLRFLSEYEYALEITCTTRAPIVLLRRSLPWMVKKTTGSPGFSYDVSNQTLSGELTISFLNQNRIIYAEGQDVRQEWGVTDVRSALPPSVCKAHGLLCCDAQSQIGVGTGQSNGVTDCPGRCFDSCLQRPTLLSFQSDPQPASPNIREVLLTGQSAIVFFGFAFDAQEAAIEQVIVDFGDGTSETLTVSQGRIEKEYTCSLPECRFEAQVRAIDVRGVESPQTRLSGMTILMTP